MKQISLLITFVFIILNASYAVNALDSTKWEGALLVKGMELKLIFEFDEGKCSLDVPAQGLVDYAATEYKLDGSDMEITFSGIKAQFIGTNESDTLIVGKWVQSGLSFPLKLRRKEKYNRPQNPQVPLAYKVEEVSYYNHDKSIHIGGTLTVPEHGKKHPVAILITGSGQQDRDESLFGHKPFLVIADYLTRHGIAVLRVDDRGIGSTTGVESLKTATSFDFAMDVVSGIKYLKTRADIDKNEIGLIGHSEGGLIASIIGSKRKDLAFIISMAGVGISGNRLISSQIKKSLERTLPLVSVDSIISFDKRAMDIIMNQKNNRLAEVSISQALVGPWGNQQDAAVREYFGMKIVDGFHTINTEPILARYKKMMIPWFRYFIAYKPVDFLPKIKTPMLILNGDNDTQVLSELNTLGFERIFKSCGKTNYKIIRYPGLNHFFQHCNTGFMDEVEAIEETISEEVLNDMSVWIEEQVK